MSHLSHDQAWGLALAIPAAIAFTCWALCTIADRIKRVGRRETREYVARGVMAKRDGTLGGGR